MTVISILAYVFPVVKKRLAEYSRLLITVGGPLAEQGLSSLRDKEFHCLGGGAYALLAPLGLRRQVLDFIIAFQTISDYLDNLCDRFGIRDQAVFRQLHVAMEDSIEPAEISLGDYYSLFPAREDGGYLALLVGQCRQALAAIPHYPKAQPYIRKFVQLYIDLQCYKHIELDEGERKLAQIYEQARAFYPGLSWWEYAAASGSTLGIFSLVADRGAPDRTWQVYMPWLNGLHIMLDYFIDEDEDQAHGDMNLMAYYGPAKRVGRLLYFYRQGAKAVLALERPGFHALVVDGLLALYLSDPKAKAAPRAKYSRQVLAGARLRARVLARLGALLRAGRML